jgi:hypothetical protein
VEKVVYISLGNIILKVFELKKIYNTFIKNFDATKEKNGIILI